MNEEQIQEARERLNISVEGETTSSTPLEAFDDMVCKQPSTVACRQACMLPVLSSLLVTATHTDLWLSRAEFTRKHHAGHKAKAV